MTTQRPLPVEPGPFEPGQPRPPARHVAIVGAGLSGSALAWHLARLSQDPDLRITLIDPRAEPGGGLAYSTPDPDHRINVPHHRMTLDTAEPDHFARWLASPAAPAFAPEALRPDGAIFPPRAVFGAYVRAHLQPFLDSGRILHLKTRAIAARRSPGSWRVSLEDGREVVASALALAATHPAPGLLRGLEALAGSDRLIADPYAVGALDGIAAQEEVLIIGSGLTGADMVASLMRRGHRGRITLLSRSGRRSQPHGPAQGEAEADFAVDTPVTALALLRRVRAELTRAASAGLTWHPVFDRLRNQGPVVWAALPLDERRRLLRHLRGLWDIHRFRIAPQTHETLLAAEAAGQVVAIAGRITGLARTDRLDLSLRLRRGGTAGLQVDRIILATGPAHGSVTGANPLYGDLARQGLITTDPLALGLHASASGEAIDAGGHAQPDLLIAGPLARAAVGELMGVPEVTHWAEKLAAKLAQPSPVFSAV